MIRIVSYGSKLEYIFPTRLVNIGSDSRLVAPPCTTISTVVWLNIPSPTFQTKSISLTILIEYVQPTPNLCLVRGDSIRTKMHFDNIVTACNCLQIVQIEQLSKQFSVTPGDISRGHNSGLRISQIEILNMLRISICRFYNHQIFHVTKQS